MLDATQIVVSILGLGLIAGVLVFFFGSKRKRR
ncbi:MAG TPA: LPXTG cell wall anchor domain-containing protein [Vicinamibacterales bacterium]|nr:LPXTG cell wall anchor domain-containing protein [Vicinamibacterales bacterium]